MTRLALPASLLLAALAAPAVAQAPAAASMTRIGAAAAVAGRVLAIAPSAKVGRVVGSGKPIFLNDHVTTDAAGRLQVLLLDQTVFTLGPNSDMVLDEFVYDPTTNAGTMTANVVKGTFRFVSGHMAHEGGDNMKVRTPSGTMGIRGTIAVGQVGPNSSTFILAGPGAHNNAGEPPGRILISADSALHVKPVPISNPGFGTTVTFMLHQPPVILPPAPMGPLLNQLSRQFNPPMFAPTRQAGNQTSPAGASPSSGGAQQAVNMTAGPSNPTTASGQDTAATAQTAGATAVQLGTTADAAAVTTTATQDFAKTANVIADGPSTWDQIAQGLTTGIDHYSMSGTYSCSGGTTCGVGTSGSASVSLTVDWGARQYGNYGSAVIFNSAGQFLGDSATIKATAFPATTGPAAISLGSLTGARGTFTGTITLKNAGGIIARDATSAISYSGFSSESGGASVSGSRASGPGG